MSDTILTHDAAVSAFDSAAGAADSDGDVSFDWDEQHVVKVDAPADLEGAFDTDRFYKIADATVARPIKQPYMRGGDMQTFKKPAEELKKAAWSFDNAPFTLGHPDTGMVKDVDDIHGFWRGAHYDEEEDRLKEDLYVPVTDDEAMSWLEEYSDVSVGFYNRLSTEYDGETGDLSDDDVDAFQVDMYGNHIAGVENGRCSGEDGCGLDDRRHGAVLDVSGFADENGGMDLSVPESAQDAAQEFLDAVDADKVPDSCGGENGTGRRRADMFAEGGELSLETWVTGGTDAVANWHPRHEGNEDYDEGEVDTPWEDCGYAMFKAWGGKAGRNKAARLKEQHNENTDASTVTETEEELTMPDPYNQGTMVSWQGGDARGEIIDKKTEGCFNERIDGDFEICADGSVVYLIEEDDGKTVAHKHDTLTVESSDSTDLCGCKTVTADAPEGLYQTDGMMFAVAPDEHSDNNTSHPDDAKYPVNDCGDVQDAWSLKSDEQGDYNIEQSTLEMRIKRAADAHDCPPEFKPWEDNETMNDEFTIQVDIDTEATVDALAEEFDAVAALRDERDEYEEALDERRERIDDAFDAAENFDIDLSEDECRCDGVEQLVEDLDEHVDRVESLEDELTEYREEEIQERLDTLEQLGADREEWSETADGADDPLTVLDEEIERREEVLDQAGDVSPTDIKESSDNETNTESTGMGGTRRFGRGYGA